MSNNPKQDEMRIGRLLADGLQELAAETPCLTEEQLDNLVAGTVSTEEQERLFSHIAGCDICKHAFIVTKRLSMAETTVAPKHVRPAWNYYAPLAMAATVLLVISAQHIFKSKSDVVAPVARNIPQEAQNTTVINPAPAAPPSPTVAAVRKPKMTRQDNLLAMAETLGKAASDKELDIPFATTGQAGFAGTSGAEATRFHTGFALISLAVACEAHDRNLTLRASASLIERLQRLELPQAVQNKTAQLAALLDEKDDQRSCRELASTVAAAMTARYPGDSYEELGAWTAALRVAVQSRNPALFTDAEFSGLVPAGENQRDQRGVTRMMSEIRSIARGPLNDIAWEKLDSLADDLQKQF